MNYSTKNSTKQTKKGFVILIAVLVSGLMISIGAFIANIAVKELRLSISGRDSQVAFYAADAAMECALYQDLRVEQFSASSTPNNFATIRCNGDDVTVTLDDSCSGSDTICSDSDTGVTTFEVSFAEDGAGIEFSPYARVRVIKDDIGGLDDTTVIESRGYNVQNPNSQNRVERALEVQY